MAELASYSDVVIRYEGTISQDRAAWLVSLIADASSLVRGRLPQLDTWIATGQVPASEARRVVTEIVLRRVRNPGGYRQENAGDYGGVRDATAASGRLMVLDEELDALRPAATPADVGSVALAIPGWRIP